MTIVKLQACEPGSVLLKGCGPLIQPCLGEQCWSVGTVAFELNPKGVSASCHGCSQPGVIFQRFGTAAADGSDLDVVLSCEASIATVCAITFGFPFHLRNQGWSLMDPAYSGRWAVWVACRSSLVASRWKEPEHCPDFCTEMYLPASIPDPGGARNGGGSSSPPPCGTWCITTAGPSDLWNPIVPGASGDPQVSKENCLVNPLCTPGPI